jgi:hypothetical protein
MERLLSQNRPVGVCHEINDDCDDEGLWILVVLGIGGM